MFVTVFAPTKFNTIKERFNNWNDVYFDNDHKEVNIIYDNTTKDETLIHSIEYALSGFTYDDFCIIF